MYLKTWEWVEQGISYEVCSVTLKKRMMVIWRHFQFLYHLGRVVVTNGNDSLPRSTDWTVNARTSIKPINQPYGQVKQFNRLIFSDN